MEHCSSAKHLNENWSTEKKQKKQSAYTVWDESSIMEIVFVAL